LKRRITWYDWYFCWLYSCCGILGATFS